MQTYSTSDISYFLGIQRQNINVYIRKGYLNAIMVEGSWVVTHADYLSFREEYYDSNKRNSSRGATKKLTPKHVRYLSYMLSDLQNDEVSLDVFTHKYKNKSEIIPEIQSYIIYKRDICIIYDNTHKGYQYKKLAEMYGLKVGSIQQIVNQDKNESEL